ncbi:MAG TPA: STAS domain-containing protein [Solirubrobacteraceae bacterium]|jgi:anti-sigma B factor antagonist|nr:STAS domain-containing protein [Solirubrobacteraceae bacterium]
MAPIPEHFTATTFANGEGIVMTLAGELDMKGTFVFEPRLDALVADAPEAVTFDLRGLTFVDSTGLAALIAGYQRLEESGVRSRFLRGSDDVQRIFTIAGFDGVLPFEDAPAD